MSMVVIINILIISLIGGETTMAWTIAQRQYAQSEKGKLARKKYKESEKAKETRKRYQEKRKVHQSLKTIEPIGVIKKIKGK